jgi:hypothetical protein
LAQAWIEVELVRLQNWRTLTQVLRHGKPGPESSISKLLWSEMSQYCTTRRWRCCTRRQAGAGRGVTSAARGRWARAPTLPSRRNRLAGTSSVASAHSVAARVLARRATGVMRSAFPQAVVGEPASSPCLHSPPQRTPTRAAELSAALSLLRGARRGRGTAGRAKPARVDSRFPPVREAVWVGAAILETSVPRHERSAALPDTRVARWPPGIVAMREKRNGSGEKPRPSNGALLWGGKPVGRVHSSSSSTPRVGDPGEIVDGRSACQGSQSDRAAAAR